MVPIVDGRSQPDPTVLTTEALTREVNALKSLLELRIDSEAESRTSADVAASAKIEKELHLIERHRVEQKADASVSLAAALSAAKEAVGLNTLSFEKSINKSEAATNEQLKGLNVTFTTAIEGVNRTISDLKERVSNGEGHGRGTDAMAPWVFAIIASVVAVVSVIIQLSH